MIEGSRRLEELEASITRSLVEGRVTADDNILAAAFITYLDYVFFTTDVV